MNSDYRHCMKERIDQFGRDSKQVEDEIGALRI